MRTRPAVPAARGRSAKSAQRARIRLAVTLGELESAASQLATLIANCEARGRQRSVAHLLVRSAAVDAQLGRYESARRKLQDALQRGHRLGLLRSLIDADPTARRMLGELAQTETLDPVLAFYVERLLAAAHAGLTRPRPPAPSRPHARAAPTGLQDFSEREIEMLRLLAQAMPNKKIARALGLSPETVKWYLSRIYGKLRVSGRDEAVARVRDLGLGRRDARQRAAGTPPVHAEPVEAPREDSTLRQARTGQVAERFLPRRHPPRVGAFAPAAPTMAHPNARRLPCRAKLIPLRESQLSIDDDGVAVFTHQRPAARNALSMDLRADYKDMLTHVESDRRVRALVLTGSGGSFCAGGDLKGRLTSTDPDFRTARRAAPPRAGRPRLDPSACIRSKCR